jgi:hypothetical protein
VDHAHTLDRFAEEIATLLSPPYSVDVMLLQGWPGPDQDCVYYAPALAAAVKRMTQQ